MRLCCTCQRRHPPPTGKHCRLEAGAGADDIGPNTYSAEEGGQQPTQDEPSRWTALETRLDRLEAMIVKATAAEVRMSRSESRTTTRSSSSSGSARTSGSDDGPAAGPERGASDPTVRRHQKKSRKGKFGYKHVMKGEEVTTFEKLMVATMRTILIMTEKGYDSSGVVKHGLLLSKKAATGQYRVDTLIRYDECVRDRADHEGPSAFADISHDDLVSFFCYDGTTAAGDAARKARKSAYTGGSNRVPLGVCRAFNSFKGCSYDTTCRYSHKCAECGESHARKDCRDSRRPAK